MSTSTAEEVPTTRFQESRTFSDFHDAFRFKLSAEQSPECDSVFMLHQVNGKITVTYNHTPDVITLADRLQTVIELFEPR